MYNKFRDIAFGCDANNRMVKVTAASGPDALSVYDALGNRVAARVNDAWQVTVYDAFGKCVAEYDDQEPDGGGGLSYVMSDWQGSVRLVTNAHGFVRSRTDYTAFGEKIGAGVGSRTQAQGFGTDSPSKQGYGLTEKDTATGLDHTWFRKNENQAGRWTSPDPYGGSMNIANPQSFNRYSYVQNQPTNFTDPSGLMEDGDQCMIFDGDILYEGTYRNGQCVVPFSNSFEVNGTSAEPGVLTGPAAMLHLWNPTGNTTYVNVLDSVGGGDGRTTSVTTKATGNDDKWKKRAECLEEFTDTVIDITVENAFTHLGIGIGFLVATLMTGGAGAVVAALAAAGASAVAVSYAAYQVWRADRKYRKCLRKIG